MTGKKQSQKVDDGSVAIQAARDANVNLGITTDEMRAIVETMADQLPKYAAIAATVVDERLKSFEEKIVGKFENELRDHRKAFEDPDFQFLLRNAQQTYARSGEEITCENLVNLIAERSKIKDRSLLSLSINSAVEKAGALSEQEFCELSYAFFWRRIKYVGNATIENVAGLIRSYANPFLPRLSRSDTSYSYLESLGCARISVGQVTIPGILEQAYPWLFHKGVETDVLSQACDDPTFVQSLKDAGLLQAGAEGFIIAPPLEGQAFLEAVEMAGFDCAKAENILSHVSGSVMSDAEIIERFKRVGCDLDRHAEVWNSTPLKHFELTAVGLAIGHAHLKSVANLNADLSIWLH